MRIRACIIFALFLCHAVLVLQAIRAYSPTVDEVAHLPAGLSYWRFGRFDLYRVNPPLTNLVAASPLLFRGDVQEDWSRYSTEKTERAEFVCGRAFLKVNGSNALELYRLGRLALLPFSLTAAWFTYLLSRRLYGENAGLLSLALWCVSPNVIGYAAIITPDVASAAVTVVSCYFFYLWLRSPSNLHLSTFGITLGIAMLVKTTCAVLYPTYLAVWLIEIISSRDLSYRKMGVESLKILAAFVLSLYVLNVGYLFDGSFQRLDRFTFVSESLGGTGAEPSNRFAGTLAGRLPVPLPQDFVQGVDRQKYDFEQREYSYAGGTQQHGGWWWWYLYALAVKTPEGTMVLAFMAIFSGCLVAGRRDVAARCGRSHVVLIPVCGVLILVSSQTAFSRYIRYLLPALPLFFVWLGSCLGRCVGMSRVRLAVVLGCCVWNGIACLRVHPHQLAYFNDVSGGPEHGHWHLLDANNDWGQASLALAEWINDQDPDIPVYEALSFKPLGMTLKDLGVDAMRIPGRWVKRGDEYVRVPVDVLPQGYYAVSVNNLHCYPKSSATDCSQFLEWEPVVVIGYAIHVYRIDQ